MSGDLRANGSSSAAGTSRASSEPSLDVLALAEALAQLRAAGDVPRLSALIAMLPDAAGPLADALMADEDDLADAGDMPASPPASLSPGTRQALASVFDGEGLSALNEYHAPDEDNDTPAMVAEPPARYSVSEIAVVQERAGLLALTARQRLDIETLAAQVMLSPEALRWLDHVSIAREHQPDVLVSHLAGALGVERARIHEALARGAAGAQAMGAAVDLMGLIDTIRATDMLTVAQRDYWLALLLSSG